MRFIHTSKRVFCVKKGNGCFVLKKESLENFCKFLHLKFLDWWPSNHLEICE